MDTATEMEVKTSKKQLTAITPWEREQILAADVSELSDTIENRLEKVEMAIEVVTRARAAWEEHKRLVAKREAIVKERILERQRLEKRRDIVRKTWLAGNDPLYNEAQARIDACSAALAALTPKPAPTNHLWTFLAEAKEGLQAYIEERMAVFNDRIDAITFETEYDEVIEKLQVGADLWRQINDQETIKWQTWRAAQGENK